MKIWYFQILPGANWEGYGEVSTFDDALIVDHIFFNYFSCILKALDMIIVEKLLVYVLLMKFLPFYA